MNQKKLRKVPVLVVEAQQTHQNLLAHCLQKLIPQAQPAFRATAEDALLYLAQMAGQARRFPQFVFLGCELVQSCLSLLDELRGRYPNLLVIVLSAVKQAQQVDQAYRAGAHSVLLKPTTVADWEELFMLIESYWFGVVVWPRPA